MVSLWVEQASRLAGQRGSECVCPWAPDPPRASARPGLRRGRGRGQRPRPIVRSGRAREACCHGNRPGARGGAAGARLRPPPAAPPTGWPGPEGGPRQGCEVSALTERMAGALGPLLPSPGGLPSSASSPTSCSHSKSNLIRKVKLI